MKTLKKFFAFFVVICMIAPLLTQSASAASGEDRYTNDARAYATSPGTRVLRITLSPVGINLNTGEHVVSDSIYKRVLYSTSGQSEAIMLTNSETIDLMNQMQRHLDSLSGDYKLYGWRITGTVNFNYFRLRYYTYRYRTSAETSEYITKNVSKGGNYSFSHDFAYPTNLDYMKDYYYSSIEGACYFTNSTGTQSDALFFLGALFNRG